MIAAFGQSLLDSSKTIFPLCLFLMFFQMVVLRSKVRNMQRVLVGIVLAVVGFSVFNLGLVYGLMPLGSAIGKSMAAKSPGWLILVFAAILGYGATIAEPALNALGAKVEDITQGAFKKMVLIQAVALGVAIGVTLGIGRISWDVSLLWLLAPCYLVALTLTLFSSDRFTSIAWDSAGVTTGPVTVPLVLALGVGVAKGGDGFGILAMASVWPIIAVLSMGLLVGAGRKG